MVFKLGRGGKFMSCSRFPDCDGARAEDGSIISSTEGTPLGTEPKSGLPIYVLTGRFGPYVQVGETPKKEKGKKTKKSKTKAEPIEKPKRASIPTGKVPEEVTLEDALKYLSLPRILGTHPDTGLEIMANTGRFGPYIAYDGDFRSLKTDSPYDITLKRAVEILKEEKKGRPGEKMVADIGKHPKTGKALKVFESKSGRYLKKGFKRIMLPEDMDPKMLTPEVAAEILKNG